MKKKYCATPFFYYCLYSRPRTQCGVTEVFCFFFLCKVMLMPQTCHPAPSAGDRSVLLLLSMQGNVYASNLSPRTGCGVWNIKPLIYDYTNVITSHRHQNPTQKKVGPAFANPTHYFTVTLFYLLFLIETQRIRMTTNSIIFHSREM